MTGTWNVKLTANYSSCEHVQVGDIIAAQLAVSFTAGQLRASEQGTTTPAKYTGEVMGSSANMLRSAFTSGPEFGLELNLDGKGRLTGRRVVVNGNGGDGGCAIIYDVVGSRAKAG